VLIERAAVSVEIVGEITARRRAEAGVAPRARPAIEGVEPRGIEGQRLTWRERITSQATLAGADGRRSDVSRERRVAAEDCELGFELAASVHGRHAVFARPVRRRGRRRRVDLITNRVAWIVDACDGQQDAAPWHPHQRAILQLDRRELVNGERGPIWEQHLDSSARRLQSIAGDERHPGHGRFDLTLALERGGAVDVRQMRGRWRRPRRRILRGAVD
jgi:hypothetical protein